jgi:hypothetical protein
MVKIFFSISLGIAGTMSSAWASMEMGDGMERG